MGNCQAIDAAALVIQHPCGRIERLYWAVSAGEVMRLNPGHYVSLIIPLPISEDHDAPPDNKTVRFTRVKLLRPTDTLLLGHAYRLITSQGLPLLSSTDGAFQFSSFLLVTKTWLLLLQRL